MGGFGEGIGAFFEGFANAFTPALQWNMYAARQAKEAEKDRAEKRAERAAAKAERDAERAENKEWRELLRQDRIAERKEDRQNFLDDREDARKYWLTQRGIINEDALAQWNREQKAINDRILEANKYQEGRDKLAYRRDILKTLMSEALANKRMEKVHELNLEMHKLTRFEKAIDDLEARQRDLLNNMYAANDQRRGYATQTFSGITQTFLKEAFDIYQNTGKMPNMDQIVADAGRLSDLIVAKADDSDDGVGKHMTELENETISNALARMKLARTPEERAAALSEVNRVDPAAIQRRARLHRDAVREVGSDSPEALSQYLWGGGSWGEPSGTTRARQTEQDVINRVGPGGAGKGAELVQSEQERRGTYQTSFGGADIDWKPSQKTKNPELSFEVEKWSRDNGPSHGQFEELMTMYNLRSKTSGDPSKDANDFRDWFVDFAKWYDRENPNIGMYGGSPTPRGAKALVPSAAEAALQYLTDPDGFSRRWKKKPP